MTELICLDSAWFLVPPVKTIRRSADVYQEHAISERKMNDSDPSGTSNDRVEAHWNEF